MDGWDAQYRESQHDGQGPDPSGRPEPAGQRLGRGGKPGSGLDRRRGECGHKCQDQQYAQQDRTNSPTRFSSRIHWASYGRNASTKQIVPDLATHVDQRWAVGLHPGSLGSKMPLLSTTMSGSQGRLRLPPQGGADRRSARIADRPLNRSREAHPFGLAAPLPHRGASRPRFLRPTGPTRGHDQR
jgi:hypothetical protein